MSQYVKIRGNLTETEVQKYSAQILSGLDYLHKNNIIHRDIKGIVFLNGSAHAYHYDFRIQFRKNVLHYYVLRNE